MTLLMHYFYWTHGLRKPEHVDAWLWTRIVWGDTRHVWDQYYPEETWCSWLLWEGPLVVLSFASFPFLVLLALMMGVLLWCLEQFDEQAA